jgi:prolyl oligopeptidase
MNTVLMSIPVPVTWWSRAQVHSISPETVSWIKAENELTDSYLAAVPARESIREQLTALWDYPRAGVPFERGGRWFQSRNPGLAEQPVLYIMDRPGETGHVLLDPNIRSADGTTAVSAVSVSDDGTLLATPRAAAARTA